jgi:hypothetical protein
VLSAMMRPGICRDKHLEPEDLYHQTQASITREDQREAKDGSGADAQSWRKCKWTVDLTDVRQMMSPQRAGGCSTTGGPGVPRSPRLRVSARHKAILNLTFDS